MSDTQNKGSLVERYIAYVENMVTRYNSIGQLTTGAEVSPMKVNNALSMYYDVGLTLTAEYQREKINHLQTQRDFERWWDEKFELCRKEILEEYADSKSIKPAVKEFETRVRTKFAEEYNDWQDKIAESEAKERFVLRLIGNLERYDKILVTIANNMRTEMRSLSVIDRASAVGGSETEPSATRRKVT